MAVDKNSDKMDVDKKDTKVKDVLKKDEDKDTELSEEDIELKKNLDLMVERINDPDPGEDPTSKH
jgi:26S proteasome regulatory subunit N1